MSTRDYEILTAYRVSPRKEILLFGIKRVSVAFFEKVSGRQTFARKFISALNRSSGYRLKSAFITEIVEQTDFCDLSFDGSNSCGYVYAAVGSILVVYQRGNAFERNVIGQRFGRKVISVRTVCGSEHYGLGSRRVVYRVCGSSLSVET